MKFEIPNHYFRLYTFMLQTYILCFGWSSLLLTFADFARSSLLVTFLIFVSVYILDQKISCKCLDYITRLLQFFNASHFSWFFCWSSLPSPTVPPRPYMAGSVWRRKVFFIFGFVLWHNLEVMCDVVKYFWSLVVIAKFIAHNKRKTCYPNFNCVKL